MKRLSKSLLLLILLISCISVTAAAAEPSFEFQIAADGKQEIAVSTGDIITVTFTLQRSDTEQPFSMYAMQNEICYDGEFFRLVEGSVLTTNQVQTSDIALRDHYRAFYMNTLSMGGNQVWNSTTLVGSFQLEILSNTGRTEITARNPKVSKPDGSGSYGVSANQISIVVSDECKVVFETNGGSTVASKTVTKGSCLQRPADPSKYGYRFAGWYRDVDRQIPWNFANDPVSVNLHLYAKWIKDETVSKYLDVKTDDWFFADVEYVSANGLMDGVGNGLFAPYRNTSRAMIVTILWRLEGKPAAVGERSFADVPYGQWYTEAIRWASEMGIVTGYSAEAFGPNDIITREQMAAVLYRYATAKGHHTTIMADLSSFAYGNTVNAWARDAMAWANAASLINGMPGELLVPQGQANRCQTAAILHRFCLKY